MDRPPSINRLIGIQWLTRLFCAATRENHHMRDVVREFYRLFYDVRLSQARLDKLLEHAGLPAH